mgnify:CR=1 FL=1
MCLPFPSQRVFVPILEGETSIRESSVMPSYIFIRMRMSAALHFLISDMQYVINFVGADRGGHKAKAANAASNHASRSARSSHDASNALRPGRARIRSDEDAPGAAPLMEWAASSSINAGPVGLPSPSKPAATSEQYLRAYDGNEL